MRKGIIFLGIPFTFFLVSDFASGNHLVESWPSGLIRTNDLAKQLTPSEFSLAATRFIVMLPFLPLLFAVPSATAIAMPLFMAVQDRLRTIIPNMPTLFPTAAGQGSVSSVGTLPIEKPEKNRGRRAAIPLAKVPEKVKDVLDTLYKTDDIFEQLLSTEPDCRRQAVCRLNFSLSPHVGNFLGNAITVFRLENRVEGLDVSSDTRSMLKDMIKAASSGLYRRNCASVYSRCSIVVPPHRDFTLK